MQIEMPVILKMGDLMDEEKFFQFCQMNDTLEFERDAEGNVLLRPLNGSSIANSNLDIAMELYLWNKNRGLGEMFGSSAGFTLPNGAVRSPDISWIKTERWNALNEEEKERFAPICPDFVVEIRSNPEKLKYLKDKMEEYIQNGAQLGWLIDRLDSKVYVYSHNKETIIHHTLNIKLSGETTLRGFNLDLGSIIH